MIQQQSLKEIARIQLSKREREREQNYEKSEPVEEKNGMRGREREPPNRRSKENKKIRGKYNKQLHSQTEDRGEEASTRKRGARNGSRSEGNLLHIFWCARRCMQGGKGNEIRIDKFFSFLYWGPGGAV